MNNKGMTLVELIVSITIISIILVFLINLLITVKNYDNQAQSSSTLLINQSLITREDQYDIINYNLKGVSSCNSSDLTSGNPLNIVPSNASNVYCVKLIYNNAPNSENNGYLLQYRYEYNDGTYKNVVGYKRGSNQIVRETKITMDPNKYKGNVTSSCTGNTFTKCALKITMPVIDDKDNNYDIIITYIYDKNNFTYSSNSNVYGFIFN